MPNSDDFLVIAKTLIAKDQFFFFLFEKPNQISLSIIEIKRITGSHV